MMPEASNVYSKTIQAVITTPAESHVAGGRFSTMKTSHYPKEDVSPFVDMTDWVSL
jgi:hypothetical protein